MSENKEKKFTINGMLIGKWESDLHRTFRSTLSKGTGSVEIFRHWNPPEDIDFSAYGDLAFLEPILKKKKDPWMNFDQAKKIVDEILERFSKLGSFQ